MASRPMASRILVTATRSVPWASLASESQTSSASWPTVTERPAAMTSRASTALRLDAPKSRRTPSTTIASGPSTSTFVDRQCRHERIVSAGHSGVTAV